MKKFINQFMRFSILVSIPFFGVLISYLYLDPFRVLKKYNDYSNPVVTTNRDFVSTAMFDKNHKKYNYNSFIFGSSRTMAYKPTSWKKHLDSTDSPFVFDASRESIYGIYTKIKYLEETKTPIKNAVIVICRDATFDYDKNHDGHLFIKHPVTSKESNFEFHKTFYKAFVNPRFLYNYYSFRFTKKYKPSMEGFIENKKIIFDTIDNRMEIVGQEKEITENPTKYYSKKGLFYEQKGQTTDSIQRINEKQILMIQEIKRIFDKNKTNYKIILSPLYEQKKFHPKDLLILKTQFKSNLYDFSGKNKITNNKLNYYESSHYRTKIGDSLLHLIYKK